MTPFLRPAPAGEQAATAGPSPYPRGAKGTSHEQLAAAAASREQTRALIARLADQAVAGDLRIDDEPTN